MDEEKAKFTGMFPKDIELVSHGFKIGFFTIACLARVILEGSLTNRNADCYEKSATIFGDRIKKYLSKVI